MNDVQSIPIRILSIILVFHFGLLFCGPALILAQDRQADVSVLFTMAEEEEENKGESESELLSNDVFAECQMHLTAFASSLKKGLYKYDPFFPGMTSLPLLSPPPER